MTGVSIAMPLLPLAPLFDSIIPALGWTLVHSLWQGALFAALLGGLLRLMRSAPAGARYLASCATLLLTIAAAAGTSAVVYAAMHPSPVNRPIMIAPAADVRPLAPALAMSGSSPASARPDEPFGPRLLRATVAAWALGVALMAAWHVAGWLWLRRLSRGQRVQRYEPLLARLARELGITRAVRLIACARIDVPAVVGVLRPIVLIPMAVLNDLTAQQVAAILAHELAHVRRHDYLVNLIQAAVETLMFYHPAVWWMSARVRQERENCCDDIAAAACGDAKRYALALAVLEERRSAHDGAAMRGRLAPSASGSDLLARIRRLLKLPPAPRSRRPNRFGSLAAAVLAIALVAVPLACLAQQREKTEPKKTDAATTEASTDKPSPISPDDLKVVAEDYRVTPGDLMQISIMDLVGAGVETVKSCRVSETGMVSLPLIGELKVAG